MADPRNDQIAASLFVCYRHKMRLIVFKALVLLSVFCAGLHVPAAAHSDHGDHDEDIVHLAAAHVSTLEDRSGDPASDENHDLLHHHHQCPSAMMIGGNSDESALVRSGRGVVYPREVTPLLSRACEPLTEPPLA